MNFPNNQLKNRKFYKLVTIIPLNMILEEVRSHPYRDDIYINQIITPYNEIEVDDKNFVNQLLLKEVARRGLEAVIS